MSKLKISKALSLPLSFVTSTHAILGKKRGGKSYKASVIAEEMLDADQQIVVVDPTSAWWGLRSSADGRHEGYPITIFGGELGDLPLEAEAGADLADAIVAERFSAILDTSDLTKGQEQRFLADFLERLYRRNKKSSLHLFLDEADLVAPQRPFGDEARTLGAAQSIVRRGGIKGIGVTMITQRPAELNKGVLSQVDQLTLLKLVSPPDLDAVENWVSRHDERGVAREMLASLPSLPKGDAWIWAPADDVFQRITFRDRRTFDSGKTPEVGKKLAPPKKLASVDLERLGETMRAAVQHQKDNDPMELRKQVAQLRRELEAAGSARERVEMKTPSPAVKPVDLARLDKIISRAKAVLNTHDANVARHCQSLLFTLEAYSKASKTSVSAVLVAIDELRNKVVAPASVPSPRPASTNGVAVPARRASALDSSKIGGGLRRILIALAQRPQGLTNRQIGIRAGLSSRSGTFSTYISRARVEKWISDSGDVRRITEVGLAALGHYDPLPTGPALASYWLGELGSSGAARILRVLIEAYPNRVASEEIGARAGMSSKSGTYSTYISKLRGLELIEGRGDLAASEELFA